MLNIDIGKWPEMQISQKVKNIPEALSIYINQLVYEQKRKGEDIVTLSLGEAFFDIPMYDFSAIDFKRGYHYSESRGLPELREKITSFYLKQYSTKVDTENEILISAGSKPLIFMAMNAVLNEGDEVLIHEPGWLSYHEQAKLVGATYRFIPYYKEVKDFSDFFTSKTRMVIINNPNNPAGRLYSKEDLYVLYEQCRSRGIYILVDEAYSDFILDESFYSAARINESKDGIIVINSLSKNLGISGWRVGYIISSKKVIDNVLKLNQHLITCASTVLLQYLAHYFDSIINCTLPQVKQVVLKRNMIARHMDSIGIKYLPGSSTFYFFVDIEDFPHSSLDFALHLLLKENIAVVPGSAYGKSTSQFIRISVGTESEERIINSLNKIKSLINSKECDKDFINRKLANNKQKYFPGI